MTQLRIDEQLLVERVRDGSAEALLELFEIYRVRLVRFVEVWMSPALRAKFSPEDVVQDTALLVFRRAAEVNRTGVRPFLWMRSLTREQLLQRQRQYFQTGKRDVWLETRMDSCPVDQQTSLRLADALRCTQASPSSAARGREAALQLLNAVDRLSEEHRELVKLTFFEDLSTGETAEVLGKSPDAVCHMKARALIRLRSLLHDTDCG